MTLALWLTLQATAEPPVPPLAVPRDFDLAKLREEEEAPRLQRACRGEDPDEIVVCGKRPGGGDYPYEEKARLYATKPVVAEMDIGDGAKANAHVESVAMPGGAISKRIMIGVKLPF